jgi:hypothetical protein
MMANFLPPPDNPHVRVVGSFAELVGARFGGEVNALCWTRSLAGDFGEIVERLDPGEGITPVTVAALDALHLSERGRAARDVLRADLALLREHGLAPSLDCIRSYPRDAADAAVPVHVYSFHADRAPVDADTFLCTYHGAPSEALRNEDALRRIDDPATRAALRREYGGEDDEGFREFLREQCYDLHYAARPGAQPYSFGVAHLWRIAIAHPGSPVSPCVHRAPENRPGDAPRLLLIS